MVSDGPPVPSEIPAGVPRKEETSRVTTAPLMATCQTVQGEVRAVEDMDLDGHLSRATLLRMMVLNQTVATVTNQTTASGTDETEMKTDKEEDKMLVKKIGTPITMISLVKKSSNSVMKPVLEEDRKIENTERDLDPITEDSPEGHPRAPSLEGRGWCMKAQVGLAAPSAVAD